MLLPSLVDKCSSCWGKGMCKHCPEGNPAVKHNEIIWKGKYGHVKVYLKNGKTYWVK